MKRILFAALAIALCLGVMYHYQETEASSEAVLLTGTATLANTKLSLADTYAFFDMAVDLSAYVGESIRICNTSNKGLCVEGVIGSVGTGETLSGELSSAAWQTGSGADFETFASTASDNFSAENTTGTGGAYLSPAVGGLSGYLTKIAFNYTLNSGTVFGIYTLGSLWGTAPDIGFYIGGINWATTGAKTGYGVMSPGVVNRMLHTYCAGACNYEVTSFSWTKVLTPAATTGFWIKANPGAADGGAWGYKNASFDPNQASGFTYQILSTNTPSRLIASGAVTTCKLATVNGGAMVELDTDLSAYAGDDTGGPLTIINPKSTSAATMTTNKYLLCLYDTSSRHACGYVGAVGAGETLGAEAFTDPIFTTDAAWDKGAGWTVDAAGSEKAEATTSTADVTESLSLTAGTIYKLVTTCDALTGGTYQGMIEGTNLGTAVNTTAAVSWYRTVAAATGATAGIHGATSLSATFTDASLKPLSDVAATGVHLFSTQGGTTRNMAKLEAGFDPNAVTAYKIYKTF